MPKPNQVPDAWDDDWEAQADRAEKQDPAPETESQALPSKKERWARHVEAQRKLWEEAEAPEEPNYITLSNAVPLASGFRPAMKVLSRKPTPKMVVKRDPVTGIQKMALVDDDDDEEDQTPAPTIEEIRERQQREREEKQRRYNEARAKIFGDSAPASGSSSPGTTTPPDGRQSQRGRGRGGRGGGQRGDNRQDNRQGHENRQESQSRRPPSSQTGSRELFDPGYSPKPGFNLQKRGGEPASQPGQSTTPRQDEQPIRAPRGPDSSGRGGFGFGRRGGSQEG